MIYLHCRLLMCFHVHQQQILNLLRRHVRSFSILTFYRVDAELSEILFHLLFTLQVDYKRLSEDLSKIVDKRGKLGKRLFNFSQFLIQHNLTLPIREVFCTTC